MSDDLIRRQDAIDALEAKKDKTAKGNIGQFYNTIIQRDIAALIDLPTIDAVEVVRCCECKYRPHLRDAVDEDDAEELKQGYFDVSDLRFPTEGKCPCQVLDDEFYSWIPKDDWFCADGERRDTMFFTGFLTGMIVAFIVMGAVAFIFTLID